MVTRHTLSHADVLMSGSANYAPYAADFAGRRGIIVSPPAKINLGAPLLADVDLIMDAATSTELPDTETVTYTTADDGVSPFDNADTPVPADVVMADGVTYNVWSFDVARVVSVNTSHASSVVAWTLVVTGFDDYGEALTESVAVAATGTSQVDSTLKAFKHLLSLALTAAGDSEANTVNIGNGGAIGLPLRIVRKDDVQFAVDGDYDETGVAVVADDTDPATATTGDVRGTYDPSQALNGTKLAGCIIYADRSTKKTAFGVTQA